MALCSNLLCLSMLLKTFGKKTPTKSGSNTEVRLNRVTVQARLRMSTISEGVVVSFNCSDYELINIC